MDPVGRVPEEPAQPSLLLGLRARVGAASSSPVVRQAGIFAGSNVATSALALVSTALLARQLGTSEFGGYAFTVSFLAFAGMFFEFGLFAPAARLAALADAEERRRIVAAALAAFAPIGVLFCVVVYLLSFWVDSWFAVDTGSTLRAAAGFGAGVPFAIISIYLAQGVDRLHVASVTAVLFQLLFVVLLVAAVALPQDFDRTSMVILRLVALFVAGVVCAVWLRPHFERTVPIVRELVRRAREYGFAIYVGRLLSIGTFNMDVLMIAVWADSAEVGFYTLAAALAMASGFPVQGLATALFARLATEVAIAPRWLVAATGIGLVCGIAAWAIAEPAIRIVFSERYLPAAALVLPLVLAQVARGVTGVYNTFLAAQARGRELRNANILLTITNLALNFALIPPYGAKGAAWASLVALTINLGAHIYYYRRAVAGAAAEAAGS